MCKGVKPKPMLSKILENLLSAELGTPAGARSPLEKFLGEILKDISGLIMIKN